MEPRDDRDSIASSRAPDDLRHYGSDWTRHWQPSPSAVRFPTTVEEVQELVRWAVRDRVPLVPSGGRTGLSGAAVAASGEVVVSVERLRWAAPVFRAHTPIV